MAANSVHYLPVVMDALKRSIMPALPPAVRSDAEDLMRILGCVFTEKVEGPALLERSRADYLSTISRMLPELAPQSAAHEVLHAQQEGLRADVAIDMVPLQHALATAAGALAAAGTNTAWQSLSGLIDIDKAYASNAEAAYRDIVSRAVAQDETALPIEAKLPAYLRARFPDDKDVDIESVRYIKGGFANYTAVVTLKNTVSLPRLIVVRADRTAYHPTSVSVAYEYPILTKVHEFGVCVPRLYALEDSGDVLGTPFFLADFAPGTNIGDFIDVRLRNAALSRDLAQKIARLHRFPLESLGDKVRGHDQSPRQIVDKIIATMKHLWKLDEVVRCGIAIPTVDIAFQWLDRHLDDCGEQRCLLHRELGFHNMLAEGDRITAILDWTEAAAGNPADDLSFVKTSIDQLADWEDFLAAYVEAGAPLPTPQQIDFYAVLNQLRIVVFFSVVEANGKLGKVKDVPFVHLAANYLRRCRMRLCDTLDEVLRRS